MVPFQIAHKLQCIATAAEAKFCGTTGLIDPWLSHPPFGSCPPALCKQSYEENFAIIFLQYYPLKV